MKRRIVIAFLVVFTLWPLAHRVMVAAYNVNPWKLYGWAMFCVPNPKTAIQAYGLRGDQMVRVAFTDADEIELNTHNYRRGILGSLAPPPEELAKTLLERHPEVDGIGVVVFQYHLNRETALLEWSQEKTIVRR